MNDEGSLIDLPRVCSVFEDSNPDFLSGPSDQKDGGVYMLRAAFWFWIFNNNNKNQTKPQTTKHNNKKHSSRNSKENTLCLSAMCRF